MKYLLVVAHPDDETLGAGASMWKWSHQGNTVDVCIMCTEAKARAFRPSDEELGDDTNESNKFLGVNKIYEGTFPNIEMNTVPHLQLGKASRISSLHIIQQIRTMIICKPQWPAKRQFVSSNVGQK